jgi:hypothetical protein
MQTNLRKLAAPRGARGLIAIWLLSFPVVVAGMVYALGLI